MSDDLTTTDDDGVTTTNPAWTVGARVEMDDATRARIMQLLDEGGRP